MIDFDTPLPELMERAYEAVRSINHRTFCEPIIAPDVYRILGEASALADAFPQTLGQLVGGLRRSLQECEVYDDGRDPSVSVAMVAEELDLAVASFRHIGLRLAAAQQLIAHQGVND